MRYLQNITYSFVNYIYRSGEENTVIVYIVFGDCCCGIMVSDNIKITMMCSKSRVMFNHKHSEATFTIKKAFDDLISNYDRCVEERDIAFIEGTNTSEFCGQTYLETKAADIIASREFDEFIGEIAKFEEFKYVRGGVGWLPKVKVAIKEDD